MKTPKNNQNKTDAFTVAMEEFKKAANEILKRVEFQHQLLRYQIIWLGIIVSGGISLFRFDYLSIHSSILGYSLLLAPIPSYFLLLLSLNQDKMIIALARYKHLVIRPRVKRLSGEEGEVLQGILEYEVFLGEERNRRSTYFGLLFTFGQEYVLPLVFTSSLLGIFCYFFLYQKCLEQILPHLPQLVLFGVDLFFFSWAVCLVIKIRRSYSNITIVNP